MTTSTVYITQGLPGSGKTTWARKAAARHHATILCLDNIREMLSGRTGSRNVHADWNRDREQMALDVMLASFRTLVASGQNVIVANCHLTQRIPNLLKIAAREAGGAWFRVVSFMDVSVAEAIERDGGPGRVASGNNVGADVILKLAKSNRGWRLTDEYLNDFPPVEPYKPQPGSIRAVLVDLDGTLAIHPEGSNPYAADRIKNDTPNPSVVAYLTALEESEDTAIILLSGRDSSQKAETRAWLRYHLIPYDRLIMRAEGDRRNDDIVKLELFNAHVRGKYNVLCALDDRNRVVALWRRLGLHCWQVNEGNF